MNTRHSLPFLAVTGISCLVLTGCFSAGPSGASDTASGSGAVAGDERVSIAMLQPPRSGLTPLSDDAFKLSRWSAAETLVVLDELGDALPSLASEWERTTPTDWTFTIRDGVSFHDGTPLTAEAVARSLTVAAEASPTPRILDGVDMTAVASGEMTVTVSTAVEDPLLPQRLSSPQLSILAAAAYEGDVVDSVGTGTGPFVLTAVDGTSGATLDRNEDYWGEAAAAAGIDVQFVPDGTARAAALRAGTVDIVEGIPVSQVAQIDQDLVYEVPMPRTNTLYLNSESGPFADPAVRAAARAAIDRAALVSTVYEGRADVAEGLLGPALPWAAAERDAEYQAVLEQRPEPATVDNVRISLGTFTDRAELPEVAVQLQQQLEAAGFIVEQDVREYQFIEPDALNGAFDAFILSRATVLDSGDPVAYMFSDFACEGSFNIAQFCDPAVDDALRAAAAAPAGQARREAVIAAEAEILARDAVVPLLHERVIQGEAAGVEGAARDPRERILVTGDTRVAQ